MSVKSEKQGAWNMMIVYESKTGHTRRYADMLSAKTGLAAVSTAELSKGNLPRAAFSDGVIFLGWMKAGFIQGLGKVKKQGYPVKAVCASGTAPAAEPDDQSVIAQNRIQGIPFFYLRGGCKPLRETKGMDRLLLAFFVKMLKKREPDEKTTEAISIIENGFDGVKEENLAPVLQWLEQQP